MKVEIITKKSFSVIGKLGEGLSGEGAKWIQPLWHAANSKFNEIKQLAKVDESGNPIGFWGAMSDIAGKFQLWEEKGKYLAGCEVVDNALPPDNWTKWTIPSYKYLVVKCNVETYGAILHKIKTEFLPQNNYTLVGSVHEFYNPKETEGELYLYFPIGRL